MTLIDIAVEENGVVVVIGTAALERRNAINLAARPRPAFRLPTGAENGTSKNPG